MLWGSEFEFPGPPGPEARGPRVPRGAGAPPGEAGFLFFAETGTTWWWEPSRSSGGNISD